MSPRVTAIALALLGLALPVQAAAFTVPEGEQWSGKLGTYTERCPAEPGSPGVYNCSVLKHSSATITWGDGTSSLVTPAKQPQPNGSPCATAAYSTCTFAVSGAHTYEQANTYSGGVAWSDPDAASPTSGTFSFTATVSDQDIALHGVEIQRHGNDVTIGGQLQDYNVGAQPCDYQVTIDWGDGAQSPGSVNDTNCTIYRRAGARAAPGPRPPAPSVVFALSGGHTYTVEPSSGQATITVLDKGGASASATVDVPGPAEPETQSASAIGQTTATLNAHVNTGGGTLSDCHFSYGTNTGYGQTVPCSPASFTGEQDVSAAVSGLSPATAYHFTISVTTDVGTWTGADQRFTTLAPVAAGSPTLLTLPADGVTAGAGVLHGVVNTHGPTAGDCHFDWGTTDAYGHSVACTPTPSGAADVYVAAAISGLTPDTTYHFRIVAANDGAPASAGADATFRTLPTCTVTPVAGNVKARGCFAQIGDSFKSTAGSTVDLNGLTLKPDAATTTITINTKTREITPSANVTVSASEVVISDAKLHWTEPDPKGAPSVKVGTLTPKTGATVESIALEGDLSVAFTSSYGADLAGNVKLPLGSLASGVGISGTIALHTDSGSGLAHNQLKITKDHFDVFGVGIKSLSVIYSSADDIWGGGADVTLPTPNKVDIAAQLQFQNGSFHRFDGSLSGIDVPIMGAINVQRISVVFGVNPTTIGGGLGLSFGPTVSGKRLVGFDGDFIYQAATPTAAGFVHVDGELTLTSFKVANAYFDYFTTGLTRFGGHLQLGLPDSSASDPSTQPVYIDTGFDGAVYGSKFDVDVKATVALNFIDTTVGAEVLVSDKGIVACATLSAFGFTWNPGVGYTWATGSFDPMLDGCSVGPWKTLDLGAQASAVGQGRTLILGAAPTLVELRGAPGAPPKVVLHGPHGQTITVPLVDTTPLKAPGHMVLQDPADGRTWIALQHPAGTWHLTLEDGSPAITMIRSAGLLPAPRVSGHVARRHAVRVLVWHARPVPGQKITFWETGHDVAHVLGTSPRTAGTIRFTPAAGGAGTRTVEAHVRIDGRLRSVIRVARFRASAAPLPAAPKRVTAVAAGRGRLRVTWTPVAGVAQYRLDVLTAGGAHLQELAAARVHRLVVRDVVPITAATVSVRGERRDGVTGAARTTRFPRKKHHTRTTRR